jgi:hypothetical protein
MIGISGGRAVALVAGATAVASLGSVAGALAKRAPTSSERKAIDAATVRYINATGSAAAPDDKIGMIRVSTVSSSYALVVLSSATQGPARALLHRTVPKKPAKKPAAKASTARAAATRPEPSLASAAGWKVIDFGPGTFSCSAAPKAVFADLFGSASSCAPAGY